MTNALKRHEVVALVADRDLDGGGVPVTFFGRETTMPSGPAALAPHASQLTRRVEEGFIP